MDVRYVAMIARLILVAFVTRSAEQEVAGSFGLWICWTLERAQLLDCLEDRLMLPHSLHLRCSRGTCYLWALLQVPREAEDRRVGTGQLLLRGPRRTLCGPSEMCYVNRKL